MRDAGDEHVVELEPLRHVDRHHLHGVLLRRLDRRPVGLVERLDGVDVVEERTERQLAFNRLERVHLVEERREVPPGAHRPRAVEVGVELVDDPDPPDHLAQELADGLARLLPEHAELVAELDEPPAAVLRQVLDLVEAFERLGEQERLGLDVVLGHVLEHRLALDRREACHEGEILEADAVPRPQQDPRERDRRLGIVDGARVREHLGDLGLLQQPGEPDDLDGHVAFVERALQQAEQPRRAAQHGDVRPPRATVVQIDDRLGDRAGLRPLIHVPGDRDLALTVLRRRTELLVGVRTLRLGDRRDEGVGRGEDPSARAEVRVQREPRRGCAVRAPEPLRELEQVVQGRATPGVDVLIRVADGRDRMPGPEERVHQVRLRDVRVLVLVEEHRRVPRALVHHDARVPLGDLDRAVDLVAEIDHPELALQLAVARRGLGQLHALLRGFVDAVRPGVLQQLESGGDVRLHLHGGDAMVLGLLVELEDLRHERGLPRRGRVLERHPVEHPRAELGPLRLREHACAGLEAREHAVALEQRGREPVVVRDLRLLALGQVQGGQRPAHAQPEVVRRLVREREAQDVAGQDPLVRLDAVDPADRCERQVHDARRHHGRLPRSRTSDQDARLQRPRDRGPLLLGGLGAHRRDDGGRHHARPVHAVTSRSGRPSGQSGQRLRNSHQWQSACGLGR